MINHKQPHQHFDRVPIIQDATLIAARSEINLLDTQMIDTLSICWVEGICSKNIKTKLGGNYYV